MEKVDLGTITITGLRESGYKLLLYTKSLVVFLIVYLVEEPKLLKQRIIPEKWCNTFGSNSKHIVEPYLLDCLIQYGKSVKGAKI